MLRLPLKFYSQNVVEIDGTGPENIENCHAGFTHWKFTMFFTLYMRVQSVL